MPDPEKLTAVREALPALSAGIYLNTGSVGPMPAETAAAMADIANYERDLGRAHPDYFLESLARMDEARAGVAAILGTDVGAVGLTHSTTDAMNAATLLPDWRAGGRVVTTAHEHPGGVGPLYALRDRNGVELAFVDAGADGDDDRTLAAFEAAITPDTRLVSISHVLWTTGAVMPVARIAEIAHDRGAIVVVDGAQAAGAIPFRFEDLGADLYALSAQKWLLGPEGMGALVAGRGRDRRVHARRSAATTASSTRTAQATPPGGPTAGASRPAATTGPRSSGWRARSAGCRCTSASTSSTGAGRPWPPRPPRAWRPSRV